MSNAQPYQQEEDEFDAARELMAEEDESGYQLVQHTSAKTGKTVTLQVRPPTMKEQEENRRAATRKGVQVSKSSNQITLPEVDASEMMVRNLISSVYAKKGGQWVRLWTIHDREMLLSRRGGADSLITKLTEAYAKATQLKSVEEEKGNSDASPS